MRQYPPQRGRLPGTPDEEGHLPPRAVAEAEKARTRLLHQVDEKRHPRTQVTMSFLLDRRLGVAEPDETSYERGHVRVLGD